MESMLFMYSTAAAPATASMRRMPLAIPLSLTTLKAPISALKGGGIHSLSEVITSNRREVAIKAVLASGVLAVP